MKLVSTALAAALLGTLTAGTVSAAPISTDADMFGRITPLVGEANVEFGGDGIPSDSTSFSTFMDGTGNTLRLGLSATQRYGAPTPQNDGSGTFFVSEGTSDDGRAFWNFSFYAEIDGPASIQDIGLELLYDLDPASGTHISDLGVINAALFDAEDDRVAEGSQNATFGYLSTSFSGFNTAPTVTAFDPDLGEYSFLFRAAGFGSVGINVIAGDVPVPSAVPLPAGLPLLLAGLGGLGLMRRKRDA